VTFFFAFNIDMIPSPQKRFANIVLGVFVGLQVSWEIWFGMQQKCHRKRSSGILAIDFGLIFVVLFFHL
jgi:tetrahydromethanopterin S-methyltransferase subunit E